MSDEIFKTVSVTHPQLRLLCLLVKLTQRAEMMRVVDETMRLGYQTSYEVAKAFENGYPAILRNLAFELELCSRLNRDSAVAEFGVSPVGLAVLRDLVETDWTVHNTLVWPSGMPENDPVHAATRKMISQDFEGLGLAIDAARTPQIEAKFLMMMPKPKGNFAQ